ncbi:MAG: glycoside hydrolase family 3 protein [Oscillospiraceae bacterium]|jgi:beta-N-acetylhexosaminidase|nr:glycoside hydrolase family 3 protein [Oscillospiraceae bacterium]
MKTSKSAGLIVAATAVLLAASVAALYFSMGSEAAPPRGVLPGVDEIFVRETPAPASQETETAAPAPEPEPAPPADARDPRLLARAEELLSGMTADEKIYQMFFVTPESLTGYQRVYQAGRATETALEKYPVGGIIYFEQNIDSPAQISDMLTKTLGWSKIPLFLGVDEEGGRVARISSQGAMGFDAVPPMAELGASGDTRGAYDAGVKIGQMLTALGFNMDFAPVADVLANPENTEIGDRSFGSDAALVAAMTQSFTEGLRGAGIASALKHFPGQGGAESGTHDGPVGSARTIDELRGTEFLPFSAGIGAGADFVLVSHLSATGVDASGEPSSLSRDITTGLLREELGFGNIIITDSLSMGAVTQSHTDEEATVLAVLAGADMLLMPRNLKNAADAVKSAVSSGEIAEGRIDESVLRILYVKLERGIIG